MSWWRSLREGRRLRPQTVAAEEDAPSAELGDMPRAWIDSAFATGEDAERREAEQLARLRADPERALAQLSDAYERTPESEYALRWALVRGVGQLKSPAALAFLQRVLRDEIPPERSRDIHHFSTVAEETSLRLQALEGIASLASEGNDDAVELLLEQLTHPSFTVRVMSTQALRALPGRAVADEELRLRLPADDAERALAFRQQPPDELETEVEPRRRAPTPRPPGGESGTVPSDLEQRRPPRAQREGGSDG